MERLTELLQAEGLERLHVIRENDNARLCLHYDPQRFSVSRVRESAQAAGARIGYRFHHENLCIDGMDCATVIEHALRRMDGVLLKEIAKQEHILPSVAITASSGDIVIERNVIAG